MWLEMSKQLLTSCLHFTDPDLLLLIELARRTLKQVYNWKVKQVKTSFHSTERLKINVTKPHLLSCVM